MDISRTSKVISVAILIILLAFTCSCKGTRVLTTNTEVRKETQEIITKRNPYKLEVEEKIKFDSDGDIKPIELKITHNEVDGIVTVKDGLVKFTIEQPDTLTIRRDLAEKLEITDDTDLDVLEAKAKTGIAGWWSDFKRKVVTWSIILNVIFIAGWIFKFTRRVYMPYY